MSEFELSSAPLGPHASWSSLAIGVFSILHIVPAALSIGFMVLAPVLEWRGWTRPYDTDLARALTRFTVLVFSVSTVLAVIMVELLIGLFPVTTMWIWNRFRSFLFIGMGAFAVGLLTLYPYYHWWDAIRRRSLTLHVLLGTAAAVAMLAWVVVLDGMGSSMLTPGEAVRGGVSWGNPTWVPLVIHRLLADLVIAGYVIAGYAAWKLSRTRDASERRYDAHVVKHGWLLGLSAFLVQPWSGLVYAERIARSSPGSYEQLVRGDLQGLLYLQFGLVGLLFLGNHVLIRQAGTAQEGLHWTDAAVIVAALCMVVSAGHPVMRRLWLAGLVVLTLWSLWTAPRPAVLQHDAWITPRIRAACLGMAFVSILLYLTMGVIRETIRHPDTVRGVISLGDQVRQPVLSGENR